MDKIGFIVVRYGKEINGGAELHCRMLAERLKDKYDVEVLTTCIKNYITGINELPEGETTIDGITVRRFRTEPEPPIKHRYFHRNSRLSHFRRFLSKIHILDLLNKFFPVWNIFRDSGEHTQRHDGFYSPGLCEFIQRHKTDYKALIAVSLDKPTTYFTALYAPERTIIIPTLHDYITFYAGSYTYIMTHTAYIAFNTTAEEKLAERIFGPHMAPHGIVSVGIEMPSPAPWEATRQKYDLPTSYLLYAGRIEPGKIPVDFYDNFLDYKKTNPASTLKLVMMGKNYMQPCNHPDIIYTGFVSDEEKSAIIRHAKVIVNPSGFESLSLILLEALYAKVPMLANGHCNVLEEHARKSHGAVKVYYNKKDFISQLDKINSSKELREEMVEKGERYFHENYDWNVIIQRLTNCIDTVIRNLPSTQQC